MKKVENGMSTYYFRSTVLGGQVVEMNSCGGWTRGYVYSGSQLLAVQQSSSVNWEFLSNVVYDEHQAAIL